MHASYLLTWGWLSGDAGSPTVTFGVSPSPLLTWSTSVEKKGPLCVLWGSLFCPVAAPVERQHGSLASLSQAVQNKLFAPQTFGQSVGEFVQLVSVSFLTMHFHCALCFSVVSAVDLVFICTSQIPVGPAPCSWFTILLFSRTDKLFTSHQRRLLPAERYLSALSSLHSIFPSLSPCFPFLMSPTSCRSSLIPSLVQNPTTFLHCVKNTNKRPSLSCISFTPFHFYSF